MSILMANLVLLLLAQAYSSFERQSCLVRADTTSLLMKETPAHSTGTAKQRHDVSAATNLGPSNMVLPTPHIETEGGRKRKSSKITADGRTERESQVNSDQLFVCLSPWVKTLYQYLLLLLSTEQLCYYDSICETNGQVYPLLIPRI